MGTRRWQCYCGYTLAIMKPPSSHYMTEHFPDLDHPMYQAAFERIAFVFVTSALAGLMIAAIVLVAFELVQ